MPIISISTAFNIDLEFELAAMHKRLLAYIIDFVLLIIYLFGMKWALYGGFSTGFEESVGLDILVISVPMFLYSLVMELLMNGQTIGKKIMAIRVISLDGGDPVFGQFVLRWITKFFEWPFFFGYVMLVPDAIIGYILGTALLGISVVIIITVTKNSQRLGDLAAGTVVVDTKSAMSVDDTVFMNVSETNYKVLFPEVMRLSDNDINTIKSVLTQAKKRNNIEMCLRVESKVKEVLNIRSDLYAPDFLEKLLEDYNYLATKE